MPKGNPNPSPSTRFKLGNQIARKWYPENVLEEVLKYIDHCEEEKKHPNFAGFYLHSGITAKVFSEFEARFKDDQAVMLLCAYIEDFNVQGLRKFPAGSFIHLKQKRFGWKDSEKETAPAQRVQNIQINISGSSKEAKAIRKASEKLKIPENLTLPPNEKDQS